MNKRAGIGALLISIFVGWVWGIKNAGDGNFPLCRPWGILVPVAIVALLVSPVWPLLGL